MALVENELVDLATFGKEMNPRAQWFSSIRDFEPFRNYRRHNTIYRDKTIYRAWRDFHATDTFNIRDWEEITFDTRELEETDPLYTADKPNIAFLNKENVFAENQQFNKDVNVDGVLTANSIEADNSLTIDGKDVATSEDVRNAMLATQTWLPAVQTVNQLPTIGLDPNINYLCKVLNDTSFVNNGVWQAVAGWTTTPVWSYFSDNVEFVNSLELQNAISQHNMSLNPHSSVVVRRNEMGAANGVASLDGNGRLPLTQLPDIPGGGMPIAPTTGDWVGRGNQWVRALYDQASRIGAMGNPPPGNNLNNTNDTGWYIINEGFANSPDPTNTWYLFHMGGEALWGVQFAMIINGSAFRWRRRQMGVWQPWREWAVDIDCIFRNTVSQSTAWNERDYPIGTTLVVRAEVGGAREVNSSFDAEIQWDTEYVYGIPIEIMTVTGLSIPLGRNDIARWRTAHGNIDWWEADNSWPIYFLDNLTLTGVWKNRGNFIAPISTLTTNHNKLIHFYVQRVA